MNQVLEQIKHGIIPDGYKQTEAGIIPMDWSCKKLSELSTPITQTAGTDQYETLSISAGIGFVNQAEKFGKELSGKQYEKYTVLHKGDFSYNKGNSGKYPQGCIYRLKDRESAAVPNVFESFCIKSGCPDYYDQLFTSGYLNHQLYRLINHGVRDDGLLNLTQEDFYSCTLPVPPVSEQEKIAEILATQDSVIELCQKNIEQLKKLKKVFLQKMFPKPGATVPEWRFPGFTDAWEQRKLADIASDTCGGGTPKTSNGAYWTGDIPWIQSSDLTEGKVFGVEPRKHISMAGLNCSATQLVPESSIAVVTRVGVGKLAYMPYSYTTSQDFLSLCKLQTDPIFTVYGLYQMLQGELSAVQGTSIKGMTKEDLLSNAISVPNSIEEQARIGAYFKSLDNLITLHQRKCDEEKQKKKALMQLLLTGIVRLKI